jgi:hypothetical protein
MLNTFATVVRAEISHKNIKSIKKVVEKQKTDDKLLKELLPIVLLHKQFITLAHEKTIKFFIFHLTDISRLDKSPLLANGYNAPPTHLNHMPFMQMSAHHGAPAMMSPGMLPRPDAAMMKNQNIPGMEAIARQVN